MLLYLFLSQLPLAVLKCSEPSLSCHTGRCGRLSLLCLPPSSPRVIDQGLLGQQRKENCGPINRKLTRKSCISFFIIFFSVKPHSEFVLSLLCLLYLCGWQAPLSTAHPISRAETLMPWGPLPCHAPLIKLELEDPGVVWVITFPYFFSL